ncbi:MAG TPA: cation:dicarboxylase symporter family transporter [Caulobacteraceae bacterium]|nr:cation:dicarboxylase symporter family transporter [Caulobacteraceae bacterium]
MTDVTAAAAPAREPRPRRPLWRGLGFQVAVSMVLGVLVGLAWPEFAVSLKILGDIFLRLIKTVVAPLVFLTVVLGMAAAGDFKRIGKVGLVAIVFFEVVSTVALAWGMAFGALFGVGRGIHRVTTTAVAAKGAAEAAAAAQAQHPSLSGFLLNVFPDNFLGAFTRGETLQVLVVALIFGVGLMMLKPAQRGPVEAGLNALSPAIYKYTDIIMNLAPIGAFGAMAYAVASNGTAVLIALGWFVVAYYLAQILFVLVVLGAVCAMSGLSLFSILSFIRDEIFVVLGTASSESVLPRLLEKLPVYGASKQTVGLALPTGYVFNLGGAAIYMSMGVVFLSNAFSVHLGWAQLGGIFAVMLLTSKGVATVTGGAFVSFAATVTATGLLPLEGLPLMFGVYRLMSPANSTVNAITNAVTTIAIAKVCGEFDPTARARIEAGLVNPDDPEAMQSAH